MKTQAGAHGRPEGRPDRHARIARGDYFSSDHDLYLVEGVDGRRALVEDCRTGTLIDMPIAELRRLRPVRPDSAR